MDALILNHKSLYALIVVVVLFCASGASCPKKSQLVNDNAPVLLSLQPSLEDIIRVVNANSTQVQKVQSTGATLTVPGPGIPALEATYAFERPNRFRLRAETRLAGPELDLGSNDEAYWMWVKRSDERAVYWGRHEQFYQSATKEIVPVPPNWLIEALGVVEIDPTGEHEGPFPARPGHLQIRSRIHTPSGELTKITVVDASRGWVVEQHLFDTANQPLASALASGFQYDASNSVSLPRNVEIRLPPADLVFTLKTERHLINQVVGDDRQLWAMPQIDGYPYVDLGNPNALQPNQAQAGVMPNPYSSQSIPRNAAIRRLPPFDRLR
ncbi:MAG: hypothetical protein P8N76_10980 [Pirellulaceae bacterium]|nr:hypothetical protein [Pirellulaceae bacterium]